MAQKQKINALKNLIEKTEQELQQAKSLLKQIMETEGLADEDVSNLVMEESGDITENGKVIEGVFDGQNMIANDGKQYSIPANYASKSKLVEGDILKLTIKGNGAFIFKQIGPIDRDRLIGALAKDPKTGDWRAVVDGRSYKVLLASITYYKGRAGDQVVILVPKNGQSGWAAVENIIHGAPSSKILSDEQEDFIQNDENETQNW